MIRMSWGEFFYWLAILYLLYYIGCIGYFFFASKKTAGQEPVLPRASAEEEDKEEPEVPLVFVRNKEIDEPISLLNRSIDPPSAPSTAILREKQSPPHTEPTPEPTKVDEEQSELSVPLQGGAVYLNPDDPDDTIYTNSQRVSRWKTVPKEFTAETPSDMAQWVE